MVPGTVDRGYELGLIEPPIGDDRSIAGIEAFKETLNQRCFVSDGRHRRSRNKTKKQYMQ